MITLSFADGEYQFDLKLPGINEIQTKCGGRIGAVHARLLTGMYMVKDGSGFKGNPSEGDYAVEDIVETIRQGLIGGAAGLVDGVPVAVNALVANRLVENYVLAPGKLQEAWGVAAAVISAFIVGYDPPKKPGARRPKKSPSNSTTPKP